MKITKDTILQALRNVQEPELHKDLVTLNMIRNLEVKEDTVSFSIVLTTPACPLRNQIEQAAKQAVLAIPGVKTVQIKMDAVIPKDIRVSQLVSKPIHNTIAIASGKGGVGKSTIAVNIAVALAKSGARVGLLDADVYGPNIPIMMGVKSLPGSKDERLIPAEAYGVRMMSMGFLVKPGQPIIWRGPMLHAAMQQFLSDVDWGELDYLVIDLPPGTGDAALSLSQSIPITGALIVTLPQHVSLEDANRGLEMFRQLNVPILGIVENMRGEFFGSGGGENLANTAKVPFLGFVPMESAVRKSGDNGKPIVISEPNTDAARALFTIAEMVAASVSVLTITHSHLTNTQ